MQLFLGTVLESLKGELCFVGCLHRIALETMLWYSRDLGGNKINIEALHIYNKRF
jgi:hypothetical protein